MLVMTQRPLGTCDYDRALSMQLISMYSVLGALDSAHESFSFEVIKTGILMYTYMYIPYKSYNFSVQ